MLPRPSLRPRIGLVTHATRTRGEPLFIRHFSSSPARFQQPAAVSPEPTGPPSKISEIRTTKQQPVVHQWGGPKTKTVEVNISGLNHTFPTFWLRDHCPCSKCTHPQTRQRQINTFEIDPGITVSDVRFEPQGIRVRWSDDDHTSFFSFDWLGQHSPLEETTNWNKLTTIHPATNISELPSVEYDSILHSSSGLNDYLVAIRRYGFCLAPSTPATPQATQDLLERISFIRPTQYGAFWDFTSVSNPTDTAYTTLPLAAHTDNTYFNDPAGLQLFHMLSHTEGSGGESIFVDGFAAARCLHATNPKYYQTLSTVPVVSHASGDLKAGVYTNTSAHSRGFPVFGHYYATGSTRKPQFLSQIRWNNDDRSPATKFKNHQEMIDWYAAAKLWSDILRSPEFELTIQLNPGTPIIFNNWRILHGRRAFTGKRRVCGGYIGMDDFLAKGRALAVEMKVE